LHDVERADDPLQEVVEIVRDPPVNWPMASILWLCRSASSTFSSSAVRSCTRCSSVALSSASASAAVLACCSLARSADFRCPRSLMSRRISVTNTCESSCQREAETST
jgi:hypothetical protein